MSNDQSMVPHFVPSRWLDSPTPRSMVSAAFFAHKFFAGNEDCEDGSEVQAQANETLKDQSFGVSDPGDRRSVSNDGDDGDDDRVILVKMTENESSIDVQDNLETVSDFPSLASLPIPHTSDNSQDCHDLFLNYYTPLVDPMEPAPSKPSHQLGEPRSSTTQSELEYLEDNFLILSPRMGGERATSPHTMNSSPRFSPSQHKDDQESNSCLFDSLGIERTRRLTPTPAVSLARTSVHTLGASPHRLSNLYRKSFSSPSSLGSSLMIVDVSPNAGNADLLSTPTLSLESGSDLDLPLGSSRLDVDAICVEGVEMVESRC